MPQYAQNILHKACTKDIGLASFLQPLLVHALELKEKDDSYAASASILKNVIPCLPVKMAMTDNKGCIISSTQSWQDDPTLKHFEDMLKISTGKQLEIDHKKLYEYATAALEGESIKDKCMEWRDVQGKIQWMILEMNPWMSLKECVGGMIIFLEDVTILKKQESDFNDLELFAYMCPHDLKSSVRIINNFLMLLDKHQGPKKDETEKRYFDFMFKALYSTNEIIEHSFLTLALKNETSTKKRISLMTVMESVIQSIQPVIDQKKAQVTLGDLHHVEAGCMLLKRVMLNLITNALKFSLVPRIEIYSVTSFEHVLLFV
ncbi:MAG: hypothetical protein K2X98_05580, partial [Alphaproteobacteria bacterium]|nr:hypothetical protein [Alphaproteobacteria bacterium]